MKENMRERGGARSGSKNGSGKGEEDFMHSRWKGSFVRPFYNNPFLGKARLVD